MDAAITAEAESAAARRARSRRLHALGDAANRPLRRAGILAVLAGLLLIPQAAAIAHAMQKVFMDGAAPRQAAAAVLALLACAALRSGVLWASRRQADDAVQTIRQQLRTGLFRRLAAHGPRWLRQQRSGELAELGSTHVEAIGKYFSGFAIARIEVAAVPLALLVAAFSVDWVVGLILLFTLPLIPVFMALAGWGAEAASRRQMQAITRMGGHFADRLRGLGLIRLYGRGEAELAGVRYASEGLRERTMRVLRIALLSSAVLEFFASLSVAMVAVYLGLTYLGMLHLRGSELSLFTGVFCLILAPEFYAPLRKLAAHYHDRAAALAALDELEARQATATPADTAVTASSSADPATKGIVVRDLSLRPAATAPAVFSQLSFALQRGEKLAIAGPSGCGKSTLLEALAGWLPADSGDIRIEPGLRIAYAPQRPHLFHGSIADNLRMAAPDASDAQLQAAAEAAQVGRIAAKLPQGLDTLIGERGFGLSGGEARRIALARALLRDPDVLLLDEPTAFLDPATEAALLHTLEHFARDRILVIATHSAAAMRMAGRVLWLPAGHIGAAP